MPLLHAKTVDGLNVVFALSSNNIDGAYLRYFCIAPPCYSFLKKKSAVGADADADAV